MRIPDTRIEPRDSSAPCPVCEGSRAQPGEACSASCLERARDYFEAFQLQNSEITSSLNQLQEKLGLTQNRLEFAQFELKKLGELWKKAQQLLVESAERTQRSREKKVSERIEALLERFERLDLKWRKLVEAKRKSDQLLARARDLVK